MLKRDPQLTLIEHMHAAQQKPSPFAQEYHIGCII